MTISALRRHFEIDSFTPDHLYRTARQATRQRDFVDTVGDRLNRSVGDTRRAADDDCGIERNSSFVTFLPMHRGVLEAPPHDTGLERAFDLPAIDSHVAARRFQDLW